MLPAMMLIAGLAMADEPPAEKTDTEPVVSKEEIAQLEEAEARTSKYLFLGTLVAIPPGLIAAVTGTITLVSGGAAIYYLYRVVELNSSGTTAAHPEEMRQWSAFAGALGMVSSSCSILAVVSCVMSVGAFSMGVKAFVEDPDPNE